MTSDGLNALNLEYNLLNLTAEVKSGSTVKAQYRWLADGSKAGVRNGAAGSTGLEYLGSLVYRRDGTGLKLESAAFGGGRIEVAQGSGGQTYTPNYYLTDHLGSTRVIWNGSGTIPRSDFTPFGTRWTNGAAAASRYQFAGNEDQTVGDLPYQDFGARFFTGNGKLPIFTTPDPLQEVNPRFNQYHYASNNPVNRTDPTGLLDDWYLNLKEGKLEQFKGQSGDLTNKGYERIAGDKASRIELGNALTERRYDWVWGKEEGESVNSFHVDSGAKYKAWAMSQTFSRDHMSTIAGLGIFGIAGTAPRKAASQGAARVAANSVGKGYDSFAAFKSAMGPAGKGQAWHHIVEQTPGNVARFGNRTIHNTQNVIKLPHGAGSIHNQISGHYSSKPFFTNGQTVRQWLSTQSYQAQYDYGVKLLQQYGITP